jgi:hypothetical protein
MTFNSLKKTNENKEGGGKKNEKAVVGSTVALDRNFFSIKVPSGPVGFSIFRHATSMKDASSCGRLIEGETREEGGYP